jgi:hypothetical protein
MEQVAPLGRGFPAHVHTREDEAWYVVDGVVSFLIGGETVRARAGSFLFGPRGVPHGFRVETPTARLVVFATPAGLERFFFETGKPAQALTVPASSDQGADELAVPLEKYGVEVLEPPLPGAPEPPGLGGRGPRPTGPSATDLWPPRTSTSDELLRLNQKMGPAGRDLTRRTLGSATSGALTMPGRLSLF